MRNKLGDPNNTQQLVEKLKAYKIEFNSDSLPVFVNHMESFKKRVENNEVIVADPSQYEMILDELSDSSMHLAIEIIEGILHGTISPVSMMEIVLVATHLETNKK